MKASTSGACVVLVAAFVSVNSLQCYQCIDCPDGTLKDEMLKTCGEAIETTTAPTPAVTTVQTVDPTAATTTGPVNSEAPTTTTPIDSTAATTAEPVNPTATTTAAPVDPTAATSTGPVNPEASTTATPVDTTTAATTEPVNLTATTTATTVEPTAATPIGPVNPTAATTTASVDSTAATTPGPVDPTEATTAASTSPTATTSPVPVSTVSTTVASTTEDVGLIDPPNGSQNFRATRVRRTVLTEGVYLNSGCRCDGRHCDCSEDGYDTRGFQYADNETSFVCAKVIMKNETGYEVIVRGCAPAVYEEDEFCTYFTAQTNATSCKTCDTDKCNSAISFQHSIIFFLVVLASPLLLNRYSTLLF